MEPKKNPQKDLNKKSSMYFVFGLLLVLAMVYVALEWKTFESDIYMDQAMNTKESEIEEEYVEEFVIEQPIMKQVLPQEIKIEENDT